MSIKFLTPNQEQQDILKEINDLVDTLKQSKTPKLTKNIRFVNQFTKALFQVHSKKKVQELPKQRPQVKQESPQIQQSIQPKPHPKKEIPLAPPIAPAPNLKSNQTLKLENNKLIYTPNISPLQKEDMTIYTNVKDSIRNSILKKPELLEDNTFINKEVKKACEELKIKHSENYVEKIKQHLIYNLKGYGKLEPLIQDPRVTEIKCDSYDDIQAKFEDKLIPTNIRFNNNTELNRFIENLAVKANKKLSKEEPKVDINLGNMKITILYNPIMGSRFTITK